MSYTGGYQAGYAQVTAPDQYGGYLEGYTDAPDNPPAQTPGYRSYLGGYGDFGSYKIGYGAGYATTKVVTTSRSTNWSVAQVTGYVGYRSSYGAAVAPLTVTVARTAR